MSNDATTAPIAADVLSQHRAVLLRYALVQLRDPTAAQDAVQETLLAALEARNSFRGEAALRTGLLGILKHKIVDELRRRGRQGLSLDSQVSGDDLEQWFDSQGSWQQLPRT